jgi:hypothetical protein
MSQCTICSTAELVGVTRNALKDHSIAAAMVTQIQNGYVGDPKSKNGTL